MKILSERRSRRNPEVLHRIVLTDSGEIICNCPACEHGGECYEKMKIRAQREYEQMLQLKHQISDTKIPDKQVLIDRQWAYVRGRMLLWLRKYPQDANLPQYRDLAIRHGIRTPEQILAERQRMMGLTRIPEYKQISHPSTSSTTAPPPVVATTVTRKRRRPMKRSAD